MAINNAGVIVGWSEGAASEIWSRAFRARPGFAIEDLGALDGVVSGAEAINIAGAIVGWASGRAFAYTDADGMIDLNTRVGSEEARFLYDAMGINNVGQIIALYYGQQGTGTVLLTPIDDTVPPRILSTSVSNPILFPPDDKPHLVTVFVSAVDNRDPSPECQITNVANSEWQSPTPDPSVQVTGPLSVVLAATRFGTGPGRTYTINVRCGDDSGNAAMTAVTVFVPHDNR
jgi:probable HAF family extracellular repeat protein